MSMRELHIADKVWQYQIGRTGVKLISPEGKGYTRVVDKNGNNTFCPTHAPKEDET